jgi:hypothetical protein
LTAEFGLARQADVHFLMTTGYITQGQSALYLAETTTGQFGVYTMGPGPNGAGIVIRRHDLTRFREAVAPVGGAGPGAGLVPGHGLAPVGPAAGAGGLPHNFPGVAPIAPQRPTPSSGTGSSFPSVGPTGQPAGIPSGGNVSPTVPGAALPQGAFPTPAAPVPAMPPLSSTPPVSPQVGPQVPTSGMSSNHSATPNYRQSTTGSTQRTGAVQSDTWAALEGYAPSPSHIMAAPPAGSRLAPISPLKPLRHDMHAVANLTQAEKSSKEGENDGPRPSASAGLAAANWRTAPPPNTLQNLNPMQLDPTVLLYHFLRPLPLP